MSSWEEIGEKWNRAQQMADQWDQMGEQRYQLGWQAVKATLDVGDALMAKKEETPHGEWEPNAARVLHLTPRSAGALAIKLIGLAKIRPQIEQAQPESLRKALAMLPKGAPRPRAPAKDKAPVTSDAGTPVASNPAPSAKALTRAREEVIDLEEFAKKTALDQAAILTRKQVKVELASMRAEANAAVQETLATLQSAFAKKNAELEEERMRVSALQNEAREKIRCYEDLINKRFNGHDPLQKLKILRQAVHPDRQDVTTELRTKAMLAIDHIAQCLGLAA